MLRSWLENDLIANINIIDPAPLPDDLQSNNRVSYISKYDGSKIDSDIVIIAVKPQILSDAAKDIAANINAETLLLSIAAGQSISTLENIFGRNKAIVRTMPNTPAAIGKGISACVANSNVDEAQKTMVQSLMDASGQNIWISDESLMNAVTALSGSGPAYVFYLIEALAKAGEKAGLDSDMSTALARQTVIGSAALAEDESDISAETLRKNVTSKGGTTEAALNILMDGRFQNLLDEAVIAAKNRGIELG